jgi:integrase
VSESKIASRRTSAGKPGVFFSLNAKGERVYEYWYRDSSGVRRWETVGTCKLSEAVAMRGDKQAKKQRGERLVGGDARFTEVAAQWLERFERKVALGDKAPRTYDRYKENLDRYVKPYFGRRKVAEINVYDVESFYSHLAKKGLASGTIRLAAVPLDLILADAVHNGLIGSNPVKEVRRDDRPRQRTRSERIPTPEELEEILAAATATYRTPIYAAAYSGLRHSELRGLRWQDVDFEAGLIRVRNQLDYKRNLVPLKSKNSKRDVVLIAPLAAMLKRHRISSPYSKPEDFVFPNRQGQGRDHRDLSVRGFNVALDKAGIAPEPRKMVFHDLRDYFASLLIFAREDPVQVARQLGNTVAVCLRHYAGLFDEANRATDTRTALEARVATLRVVK